MERGGLIIEGGLFTKSSDNDLFGYFSVVSTHILHHQHTILRVSYINSTQFFSQTISKLTYKHVLLSKWKIFGEFWNFDISGGGLNRRVFF